MTFSILSKKLVLIRMPMIPMQLHYSNKDPIVVVNTLNEELKEASTWCSINGMKANPDKFHAMMMDKSSNCIDHCFNCQLM
jgi:hypothetical protein